MNVVNVQDNPLGGERVFASLSGILCGRGALGRRYAPPMFVEPIMRSLTSFVFILAALTSAVAAQAPRSQTPGPDNLEDWVEFIRPSDDELAWERVGWRNALWPAVEEARELGRPILLWAMNGHPLGCT